MDRVELPHKVYTHSVHAAVTRYRNGREAQVTARYFATKEEAIAFCGDERKVKFSPGEAFRPVAA
jgi:hypothetical protein